MNCEKRWRKPKKPTLTILSVNKPTECAEKVIFMQTNDSAELMTENNCKCRQRIIMHGEISYING